MNKLLHLIYSLKKRVFSKHKKNKKIKSDIEILGHMINESDLKQNEIFANNMRNHSWCGKTPKSIMCFIPYTTSFLAGGVSTIINTCYNLSKIWDAKLFLCLVSRDKLNDENEQLYTKLVKKNFPDLDYEVILPNSVNNYKTDIAICTSWITAYFLLKYNACKEKYYLIQDLENTFSASSSVSALARLTYDFGFNKLVNSEALKRYMKMFDSKSPIFRYQPGINTDLYYPNNNSSKEKSVVKILVYARPNYTRNAFDLLVPVLKNIKSKFLEQVEILTVGEEFSLKKAGLSMVVKNLGKLNSLEELADLYRQCDIGISLITTPTFSYQHLEFMASGLCLVTNKQEGIEDFLSDGVNAVVCEPIINIFVEKISEIIQNKEKREAITKKGLEFAQNLSWSSCYNSIADFILDDSKYL